MITIAKKSLEEKGYQVSVFDTAAEATAFLAEEIQGKTVGIGGSLTVAQMKLYEALEPNNQVCWHMRPPQGMTQMEARVKANQAQVYISSVNGLSQAGEVVNIDGTSNRVAAISFGHEKVYLVVGQNKLAPTFEEALHRARNVAAPKNAQRLGMKTPCAVKGDKCYDCESAQRICRTLSVLWTKPSGCEYHVVLIREDLGL